VNKLWWLVCGTSVLVAGCGSGGSGGEDVLRQRLLDGVAKIDNATSLNASSLYTAKRGEFSNLEEVGCVKVDLDLRGPGEDDDRVQVTTFNLNCSGGTHGSTLVAIGRRVWTESDGGAWRAGKVAPGVSTQVASDPDQLARVMRAAFDIQQYGDDGAYTFRVPSATINKAAKDEKTQVEMVATLDGDGALETLETTATAGDVVAGAVQTYDLGGARPIEAPKAADVKGEVRQLRDADALTSFFGCAPASGVSTTSSC
jgi:hypothetical protein